jgi:hypothetical protein
MLKQSHNNTKATLHITKDMELTSDALKFHLSNHSFKI